MSATVRVLARDRNLRSLRDRKVGLYYFCEVCVKRFEKDAGTALVFPDKLTDPDESEPNETQTPASGNIDEETAEKSTESSSSDDSEPYYEDEHKSSFERS